MPQALIQPAIWLLVIIVGLPQIAETAYSPSLPEIARFFGVEEHLVEYTLTTYLMGFALGVFFWGNLSDKLGRKPCIVMGFGFFILGCAGCYFASSIEMMLLSRLLQGFGGGVSSVLGQAMTRDAFHGPDLGRVYASVGAALSLMPAVGPIFGGLITEYLGWKAIFLILMALAALIVTICIVKLPETHIHKGKNKVSIFEIAMDLARDKQVWGFMAIVGITNGIIFSYYAEGSFYLIDMLGLSPKEYGSTFILVASIGFCGALYGKRLLKTLPGQTIVLRGLLVIAFSMLLFSLGIVTLTEMGASKHALIALTLFSMILNSFGVAMGTPTALGLSLVNHRKAIGTASSLFGLTYYAFISLVTYGMAYLHDDTLFPMPFYFLTLSIFALLAYKGLAEEKRG